MDWFVVFVVLMNFVFCFKYFPFEFNMLCNIVIVINLLNEIELTYTYNNKSWMRCLCDTCVCIVCLDLGVLDECR